MSYLNYLTFHIAASLIFAGLMFRAGVRHGKGDLVPSLNWHLANAWDHVSEWAKAGWRKLRS